MAVAASRPFEGLTVVAIEQAVAAPFCSSRLADGGARVIKIERPEGDFARGYDDVAKRPGELLRLAEPRQGIARRRHRRRPRARRRFAALLAEADVLVQNLKPGALDRLGFGPERAAPRPIRASSSARSPATARRPARQTARPTTCWSRPRAASPRSPAARNRAGARRHLDRRHRHRRDRLFGHPRGADRPLRDRPGRRHPRLDVRRHGRLADRAAAAPRGRQVAAAPRPRPPVDRALRRLPHQGRQRHPDLDPERPGMGEVRAVFLGQPDAAKDDRFATNVVRVAQPRRDRRAGRRRLRRR